MATYSRPPIYPDREKLATPCITDHLVDYGICSRCGAGPKPLYNTQTAANLPAFCRVCFRAGDRGARDFLKEPS